MLTQYLCRYTHTNILNMSVTMNQLHLVFIAIAICLVSSTTEHKPRLAKIFKPNRKSEGDGAYVIRIIGTDFLRALDPFLMLDYFQVKLPAGFPDHPHRGFETVTYMKSGTMYHEDIKGHQGIIRPGDLQWMTAGKGIIHAEMPGSFQQQSVGFQLWINLRSKQKMKDSHYQEFKKEQIPTYSKDGVNVKVISGKVQQKQGPIVASTKTLYLDIQIQSGGQFKITTESQWNSIIYMYNGDVQYIGHNPTQIYQIYNESACVMQKSYTEPTTHTFRSLTQKSHFLLISGEPLDQPISSHGPIVMNTEEEIKEAFADYRNQRNGFEGVKQWKSKIRDMKTRKQNNKKQEEIL